MPRWVANALILRFKGYRKCPIQDWMDGGALSLSKGLAVNLNYLFIVFRIAGPEFSILQMKAKSRFSYEISSFINIGNEIQIILNLSAVQMK